MGEIKDLTNGDALNKMKELVDEIRTCMFCTRANQLPFNTRPMGTMKVEEDGTIWFMSSRTSQKNAEITAGGAVELIYSEPGKSHFLTIYGTASVSFDRNKIEELWNPIAKAWFTEGKDDPTISLIKVTPTLAHYWDTKYGKMVSLLKIASAAVSGTRSDGGGVEGKLAV